MRKTVALPVLMIVVQLELYWRSEVILTYLDLISFYIKNEVRIVVFIVRNIAKT